MVGSVSGVLWKRSDTGPDFNKLFVPATKAAQMSEGLGAECAPGDGVLFLGGLRAVIPNRGNV